MSMSSDPQVRTPRRPPLPSTFSSSPLASPRDRSCPQRPSAPPSTSPAAPSAIAPLPRGTPRSASNPSPSPLLGRRTSVGVTGPSAGSPLAKGSLRKSLNGHAPDTPPSLHVGRSISVSLPAAPPLVHSRTASLFSAPSHVPDPPASVASVSPPQPARPAPPSPTSTLSTTQTPPLALPSAFDDDYASTGMPRGSSPVKSSTLRDWENDTVGRLEGEVFSGGTERESYWDGTQEDDVEIDEELEDALAQVRLVSSQKVTSYKRLLEQSQTSFYTQIHALQTELKNAKYELEVQKRAREGQNTRRVVAAPRIDRVANGLVDVQELMGTGGFDEVKVRTFVQGLDGQERMTLMKLVLESCMPGDVGRMIDVLEHYRKTAFDILTHLPVELGTEILLYLDVPELLSKSSVSPKWRELVHHPDLWRYHSLRITERDPVRFKGPDDPNEWLESYKGLHFRELNWDRGLAQNITLLQGHSNFVTSLALHGSLLLTGSYDETIRVWDLNTSRCKMVLQAKAISCLKVCPEAQVFAVGFHDVGRTQVWSTVTWQPLQTLAGHLHGIRAVDINERYLVSAGADKAIVVWDWRTGVKVTRFGQQTNVNVGIELIGDDKVVSVTLDGIIRCFSISRREMIAQYKLSDLAARNFDLSLRLQNVGSGHLGSGQLAWMAAKGVHLTCATKNLIIHLEWEMGDELVEGPLSTASSTSSGAPTLSTNGPTTPRTQLASTLSAQKPGLSPSSTGQTTSPRTRASSTFGAPSPGSLVRPAAGLPRSSSFGKGLLSPRSATGRRTLTVSDVQGTMKRGPILSRPPKIISVVDTPEVSIGAVDPSKKRVVTSTRFSSRLGADRKLYCSTYTRLPTVAGDPPSFPETPASSLASNNVPTLPRRVSGQPSDQLPPPPAALLPSVLHGAWDDRPELNSSEKGPMSLELDHEKIVVGCQDGTVYVAHMVGHKYTSSQVAFL